MSMCSYDLAVIGGGAMGGALVRGLAASGFDMARVTVSNPHTDRLDPLAELGAKVTTDNVAAARAADLVVVAVKPWILPSVAEQLRQVLADGRREVCAIVAGVSAADLRAMFPGAASLSIAMPNTAMALGESMTFLVSAQGDHIYAADAFARVGHSLDIEERLLPAAMALASCGIAYALRYVRAAVEGGVQLGFRAAEAQAIVAETLRGAAALLDQPGAHAEAEIDKVTTPGGITIRGLNAMERAGFTNAVIAGLIESAK